VTRDAAAVGAGLAPARVARPIPAGQRLHVIGVAGAGASAAALLAHHAGVQVSGCDAGGPSPYTPALVEAGLALQWRHDAAHLTTAPVPDRVAVTKALTAIDPDHPELRAATAAGIALEPWQQVVADAAVGRTLVGVAGTHGKSTTAGWLVHVLVRAGLDPAAFVGALLPPELTGGLPSTARWGRGAPFVVEADEYAGNFDAYRPDVAIVTGAEWDHPDVFADQTAVIDTFVGWLRNAPDGATAVINVADAGGSAVASALAESRTQLVVTALLHESTTDADMAVAAPLLETGNVTIAGRARALAGRIVGQDRGTTTLRIYGTDASTGDGRWKGPRNVRLRTAGRHNAANALGVAGAAMSLGVSPAAIAEGLASFDGVGRRLERKGEAAGVVVYDDYGHHPTAIRETLLAIRQREPGRRVWAVYEPLTYHRTAALLPAFADALATADAVVVAEIWAGRDPDTTVASAAGLAQAVAQARPGIVVEAPGSIEATAEWLAHEVRDGDAVLVMGGGQSYRIADGLLERLASED
jgi:UDP-N-acetylmuramate--alanine ligase